MFGEDERAGRWSGSAKTECGLHTAMIDAIRYNWIIRIASTSH